MKLDNKTKRTAANSWIERTNPLRGLTIAQAKGIYDVARAHGSPLLQKIYDEIESSDPVLMTCVERRGAALAQLGWKITAKPGFDDAVAERHKDFLDRAVRSIDNLDSAIEHLDLAFFRGFSFVQPIWNANGTVCHISLLNSWNFLRDDDGHYMWNPDASTDPTKCVPISPAMRVVSVVRHRAIDWPALSIHIRKYLGERDWGRFIERYGIPPVDVVMAPNATETQRDDYVKAADDARDGVSTVWPSGSITSRAEGARGQDPFTAFIEHQEKLIVLAATGGTLTSLAQADTGSLAGGAQMDVWQQIVARDAVIISEALQRNLFDLILREAFPNEEPAAEFSLGTEEQLSANEAADLAGKLKVAGYTVAQDELEESVGYTLAPVPEAQPQIPGLMQNKEEVVEDSGSGRKDDQLHSTTTTHDYNSSLLSSFAADNSKLADAINLFLKNPTPEDAQDLIDALPDLVPDDPALAAIIAEEMAKSMRPDASAPSDAELANVTYANGNEHSDGNGKFVKKGSGGAGAEPSKTEAKKKSKESTPDELGYTKFQRDKIGQVGDWKTLNLPAMRDIPADPPIPLNKIEDARARIAAGETVTNPFGETLSIDNRCLSHIDRKGRNPKQLQDKLQSLDAAKETFEHPHEIWHDESNPKNLRTYVRITLDPTGRRVVNGVDEGTDHVLSWHTNDVSFDHYRKGRLLWIRK